jgi:hypothetical protein
MSVTSLRPGAEDLATPRQPVRHEVVTDVLGTFCQPCVRAGQNAIGAGEGVMASAPGLGLALCANTLERNGRAHDRSFR